MARNGAARTPSATPECSSSRSGEQRPTNKQSRKHVFNTNFIYLFVLFFIEVTGL